MSRASSQRGAALLWALMILVGVTALTAVLLEREETMRREAVTDAAALQAFHAVEGGLAHVRQALARTPGYTGETLRIGACRVEAHVVRRGAGRWVVDLAAPSGGARLRAVLAASGGLPRVVERR